MLDQAACSHTGTYAATGNGGPGITETASITGNAVQDLPDYVRKEAVIPVEIARKFVRVEASE